MKKVIVILVVMLLGVSLFSFFSYHIVPPEEEGFQFNFLKIGYSSGEYEIFTSPLTLLSGAIGGGFRYHFNEKSVLNNYLIFQTPIFHFYIFNDFQPVDENFYFYSLLSEYQRNDRINKFSINSNLQFITAGFIFTSKNTQDFFHANAILGRGSVDLGYYLTEDRKLFFNAETGSVFNLYINNKNTDNDILSSMFSFLQEDSFYVFLRGGLRFYYDNYNVEVGYRLPLINGILQLMSNPNDYLYHYYNYLENFFDIDVILRMPFLTTNYYIAVNYTINF